MSIKHIVFDIGQVLLHWDPHLIYADLIPNAEDRNNFIENVCTPEWNVEQDRGRDWSEAEEILIQDHPEKAELIRAYRSNWMKSIPYAYNDVVLVMLELIASGIDVTLLTNFNQETYRMVTKRFLFFSKPRGVTVSGEVKLIKPERAIYETHSETFDLDNQHTVFIDDSAANIVAAKQFGWEAIHFAGAEGADVLKSKLASANITI